MATSAVLLALLPLLEPVLRRSLLRGLVLVLHLAAFAACFAIWKSLAFVISFAFALLTRLARGTPDFSTSVVPSIGLWRLLPVEGFPLVGSDMVASCWTWAPSCTCRWLENHSAATVARRP